MKFNLILLFVVTLSGCQINKKNEVVSESIHFFDFQNLSSEAKSEFSEDYWLGSGKIHDIEYKNGSVIIGLEYNGLVKKLVVTENYIVVSYSSGNNSKTIVYLKKQAKLINIDYSMFVVDLLADGVLSVERDYYDILDVEDVNYQGHIFEKGKYDLKTGKYTFISNL
jgi:hypothetical protein